MAHDDNRDHLIVATPSARRGKGARGRRPPNGKGGSAAESGSDEDGGSGPIRKCIITGRHGAREDLIRLALGADGAVAPDVRARAPGRGAWIGCDRAMLEAAQKKGKLKGALQRAFKTAHVTLPDDLPARVAAALERNALDRLGLEARAGQLITGTDRIIDHARKGAIHLLIHAADAAEEGTRRLDQAMRAGLDALLDDEPAARPRGLVLPVTRSILSMALGRENVVHAALVAPAAAARVGHALHRWRDFIGRDGSSQYELGAEAAVVPRSPALAVRRLAGCDE